MRTSRRRRLGLPALLAGVVVVSLAWLSDRQGKSALLALDGEEVVSLCRREIYPVDDFWERAKVLGVQAAAAPSGRLGQWIERGLVLSFSRPEVEKWRLLGLIAPNAAVRAGSLWIKDKSLLENAVSAFARDGIAVTTSSGSGFQIIEYPAHIDPSGLSLGDDPEISGPAAKQGLPALSSLAASGRRVVVLSASSAAPGARLRAYFSSRHPIILCRLSPKLGVEGNLDILRQVAREVRGNGSPAMDAQAPFFPLPPLLAGLVIALGPLLAVRGGLKVLSAARPAVRRMSPLASPVLELCAAVAAAALGAAVWGLLINALGGGSWEGGRPPAELLALPLALGWLVLYAADWRQWKRALARPLSPARLLKLMGFAALTLLILRPGVLPGALRLAAFLAAVLDPVPGLWWWSWRWSEVFIGFPCLLYAFIILERKWGCPESAESLGDPRLWLWLGLIAPAGVTLSLGQGGVPWCSAMLATAATAALGAAFGGFLFLARSFWLSKKSGEIDEKPLVSMRTL